MPYSLSPPFPLPPPPKLRLSKSKGLRLKPKLSEGPRDILKAFNEKGLNSALICTPIAFETFTLPIDMLEPEMLTEFEIP